MGTIRIVEHPPTLEWSSNGGPPNGQSRTADGTDHHDRHSPLSSAQSSVLVNAVDRASRVGLVMRTALFVVAVVAAALAIVYTMRRGDDMVSAILARDRATDLLWERVVSLTMPVLLFIVLGAVCVAAAYVLQARALDERERALDAIARIQRESEGGVSRARTLARLTEDDLTHARREFAMQVTFGRASWWLSVTLLAVSVVYSIAAGDLDAYSLAFGGGGVLSYLLSAALKVPTKTRCNLAALSQRHLIVTGYAREIGLIEAEAYRAIEYARRRQDADAAVGAGIKTAAQEIREATGVAVDRIDRYCKLDTDERCENEEQQP
jgi:hypothetical protein